MKSDICGLLNDVFFLIAPLNTTPFEDRDYVAKIIRESDLDDECIVHVLIYIDRVLRSDVYRNVLVFDVYGCKIFLAALTCLSCKYITGRLVKNYNISQISGITLEELNHCEKDILRILDWQLYVTPDEFRKYRMAIDDYHYD